MKDSSFIDGLHSKVPKCTSDESDIGDLDENYSVTLNKNQAYFDHK